MEVSVVGRYALIETILVDTGEIFHSVTGGLCWQMNSGNPPLQGELKSRNPLSISGRHR